MQIPDLIQLGSRQFKKYLAKRRSAINANMQHTLNIHVNEELSEKSIQSSTTRNPTHELLRKMQLDLDLISQKVDSLEKVYIKNEQKSSRNTRRKYRM